MLQVSFYCVLKLILQMYFRIHCLSSYSIQFDLNNSQKLARIEPEPCFQVLVWIKICVLELRWSYALELLWQNLPTYEIYNIYFPPFTSTSNNAC